ncbi:hypothetical protein PQR71_06945 [Paraburkholderia fungorum]|uniref:hypothetical protein n=1 Tax=Paraburkholderia fungorum TaxID=134537 RepID=UPI0038BBC048
MATAKKNSARSRATREPASTQSEELLLKATDEPELWKPLQPLAASALRFWRVFLDLRDADGNKLDDVQFGRFEMLVRAVSWVESRHGTGTGNYPKQDPMQCGNPNDAWWRELSALTQKEDRFVRGPDYDTNYNASELPVVLETNADFPVFAKVSSLNDMKLGHRNDAFNPTMSIYWGVPHLIWKTNVPRGRRAYQCGTVSREDVVAGATDYNGTGDPDYKTKIEAALIDIGWPTAVTLEEACTGLSVIERSSALVERALNSIEKHSAQEKLFPHGITKISMSFKLGAEGDFSLTIEGPQQANPQSHAAKERDGELSAYEMEDHAPPSPPPLRPRDPQPATAANVKALDVPVTKSIAGTASLFTKACVGGDSYENNCAHFLSDAFIRAGYSELDPPSDCIHARCSTSAKRPIRARDMWCWFKSMASQSRTTLPHKEGLWAIFQLDEKQYWGGHVVIVDTDSNVYYGTANYPNWDQYCYKW